MRMTGRISIQLSVPMDVEIAGDDIEANLELEAFKLLKLDDVQKANFDMDIITDEMREVVPNRWVFWRQHCLGCIGKDAPERMARRMVGDNRGQAIADVSSFTFDQFEGMGEILVDSLVRGDFKDYDLERFATEMLQTFITDMTHAGFPDERDDYKVYGMTLYSSGLDRYPDIDDEEVKE